MAFGVITVPIGLANWHGLGKYFGIGAGARSVGWGQTLGSVLPLLFVIGIALVLADR